jgi:hypothetical protein
MGNVCPRFARMAICAARNTDGSVAL